MTNVRARAADVIEPFVIGRLRRRERAEGIATELDNYGLLQGTDLPWPDVQQRVANQLQCRMDWSTAEHVAQALYDADLLTLPTTT